MINQGNNVPDKTIAVWLDDHTDRLNMDNFSNVVSKPPKKRKWFDTNFYNCRPLVIGNQQGFVITADYGFKVIWNGGNHRQDLEVIYEYPEETYKTDHDKAHAMPKVFSHFGFGTISIATPFLFRTPPGVNLMTINPPNYLMKNATVLTGSVETDNLSMPFTFNIRIHEPYVVTDFPKGTPLSGFIPVPRYFCDDFEIKDASTIFDKDVYDEEKQTLLDSVKKREDTQKKRLHGGEARLEKDYFYGKDVYGNSFPDHQKP
jgi:hypothetical protein